MADHAYGDRTWTVAMTVGVGGACWVLAVRQMQGMDMGVGTALGSFGFFLGVWAAMMAAMMLPGTAPAVGEHVRTHRRTGVAVTFLASYLAVWTLFGVAAYLIYRPHGTAVAGAVTVAAGLYELTPLKRHTRKRCRERVSSGFELGLYCVGSTLGLMLMLLALGAMSIAWMSAVAVLVLMQKLLSPRTTVDALLALAIVAFGVLILIHPSAVPGLVPAM